MMAMNRHTSDPDLRARCLAAARVHLAFVCELYTMQLEEGRYVIHEHPASASSWPERSVQDVMRSPAVACVVGHQCQYGQSCPKAGRDEGPVKQPARWMTNSPRLVEELGRVCSGRRGQCISGETYAHLVDVRARAAAKHPEELCLAMLRGMRRQCIDDGLMQPGLIGSLRQEEGWQDGEWPDAEEQDQYEARSVLGRTARGATGPCVGKRQLGSSSWNTMRQRMCSR